MRVPREFQTEEMKKMENPYVRVTKAMYGLPSVGFDFARYTESKLVGELGYSKVAGFPSMYVRKVQGKVIILGVYVDDLYMTGDLKICRHEIDKIGTLLCSQKKTAEVTSAVCRLQTADCRQLAVLRLALVQMQYIILLFFWRWRMIVLVQS